MTPAPPSRSTRRSAARSRRVLGVGLVALAALVPATAACSNDDTVEADGPTSSTTVTTMDPNAVTTIPDMGNVVGPVGSCLGAAAKFTNLVQGVLEGGEGAKRSQEAAEQLKAELPAELDDDADVVAAKFGEIAARGGALTDADVNDPAYNAASAALSAYFAKNCQG
ncbi:MAG TPA: hypothetical protein PKZ82_08040 [Microthrixaceae bacterium]|nr:hypothetical protein [Microthrixaceae bacterium]